MRESSLSISFRDLNTSNMSYCSYLPLVIVLVALSAAHLCSSEACSGDGQDSFYLIEIGELPITMVDCEMSIYGEALYQHLLFHPRRTTNATCSKFAIYPPYLAYEMHWPLYGYFKDNFAIPGRDCYDAAIGHAVERAQYFKSVSGVGEGYFVVLVDLDPNFFHALDAKVYAHPALSWARLNTLEEFWRPLRDVSMPPPVSEILMRYKHGMRAPLPRKYLATFLGTFNTNPVRTELGKQHDPEHGVLFMDTKRPDFNASEYRYGEVMARSKYTLVVRGHREYSYRFTEAVCSGSVPVLIADGWVAPFTNLLPFEKYGVRVLEKDVEGLTTTLRLIDDETWLGLQKQALSFCHRSFISVHHQWDTMLEAYFTKIVPQQAA